MKKAVITILGLQGQNPKTKKINDYNNQATYYFEDYEEEKDYFSTLPLLIEKYQDEYDIVPIYTKDAKIFNQDVLEEANLQCVFDDEVSLLKDDKDYLNIFSKIDSCINSYDSTIVDLTHGFRHIPILAMIDIVIQNFKSKKKVEKILFAKEINKHTPSEKGKYEIIDLKNYLDIASISYLLSSFENNYTITNNITTSDKNFQKLIDMLREFSEHIMANSLITLLRKENSLIDTILSAIKFMKNEPKAKPLKHYLESIEEHLKEFLDLIQEKRHIQLYELAKIMKKKGYFLNAITLLNEAVACYCIESLKDYDSELEAHYKKAVEENIDTYKIFAGAKDLVKSAIKDSPYNNLKLKNVKNIHQNLKNIDNIDNFVKKMIQEVNDKRNNLAHANSGDEIKEIKNSFKAIFDRFNTYCIEDDILNTTNRSKYGA